MKRVVGILTGVLCLFSYFSACKEDIVSSPAGNGNNIYNNGNLTAPKNLKATQGGYRSISLSWTAVSGALRYKIYASDSIYEGDFVLFAETEKNSLPGKTISNLTSGLTKYFKVTAVDANEKEGPESTIVCGSTLAVPVITSVEQNSESDETDVIVNWWMENCTAETYASSVQYEVVCYTDEKGSATAGTEPFITDGSLSAEINGLSPNTTYYFQVIASLQGAAYEEKSDIIDSETARKLTPEKALDFKAEQGESTESVTLSWTLPNFVDIKEGSTYARRPIYFKVFRKLSTEENFSTVPYVAYIGSNCNVNEGYVSKYISSKTIYTFNAQDCSTNNSLLTIEAAEATEENSLYLDYVGGYKIYFTDKSVLRNTRYDYKIQSYTDYYYDENTTPSSASLTSYSKLTTSAASVVQSAGWPLGKTSFSVNNPEYTVVYDEDGTTPLSYSGASLTFNFTFNDTDVESDYTFVLSRKRVSLTDSEVTEYSTKDFSLVADLNSYVDEIKPLPSMNGRYTYSVIVKKNSTQKNVEMITSQKSRFITADLNPLELENFFVQDGYLNKYEISFSATSGNTYVIKECDSNSDTESEWKNILTYECSEAQDYIYEYKPDDIASGETRWFKADIYKTETQEKGKGADAVECGTLGTPSVTVSDISYTGMTVSFAKVNKADSYVVSYVYENDTDSLALDSDSAGQTVTLSENEADEFGNFEIPFTKIAGYDNAQYAGLPLTVKVEAMNSSLDDENKIAVEKSMKLFGPAATIATVSQGTAAGSISVSWNAFEGANSYLVIRRFYDATVTPALWSDDVISYWVDGSTCELSEVNQKTASVSSVSLSDGVYTLKDCVSEEIFTADGYKEVYKKQQSRLAWGQKFEYIVVPLKEGEILGGTYASGILDVENGASYSSGVSNISRTGFALGYGIKVNASKGWQTDVLNKEDKADNNSIYVSWSKPEIPSGDIVYYIYRYDGSSWELTGQTSSLYYIDTKAEYGKVYRYLVGMSCGSARSYPVKNENEREYMLSYYDGVADSNYSDKSINHGWVLSQPKVVDANKNDSMGTMEKLIWTAAEINEEANYGINGYVIEVLSNDLSDWTEVASYSFDTADKTANYSYSFDGSANAATKILRDYKHFYRVRSYVLRDSKYCYSEPTEFTFGTEDEYVKWGTRALSDEELVKSAMYSLAYAFYLNDGGNEDLSNTGNRMKYGDAGTISGENGSAVFTKGELAGITDTSHWGKYSAKYTFSSYTPKVYGPLSEYTVMPVKISCDTHKVWMQGLSDYYLYEFADTHDITVEGSVSALSSQNAVINFYCPTNNKLVLKLTRNGVTKTIVETSDNATRRQWFPMQISGNSGYDLNSEEYGWW